MIFVLDNLEKRYQDSQLFAAKQMSALVRKHEKSMADERKEYEHEVRFCIMKEKFLF